MNDLMKQFIPPLLFNLSQKILGINSHKIFRTYHDALNYCTKDAYEEKELIDVILLKTKHFCEKLNSETIPIWDTASHSMLSIVNPIIENNEKEINILDFGGACGAHYFHLRSIIDKRLRINWVVVETPTMVKSARELETEELSFFDNFDEAKNHLHNKIDLIHTSGTLQCVDNPDQYLNHLLDCKPRWILFNRLGLNKIDRDVITIHSSKLSWNGIGELPEGYSDKWIKYPFTFQSERKFIEKLQENYLIIAKFNDISGMYPVNGEEIVGYGILCKQKLT